MLDDALIGEAETLFRHGLGWLSEQYGDRVFYVERDLVYTLQTRLNQLIAADKAPLTVCNDYPMLPGPRRHLSADLALIAPSGDVAVAVEFKYEPCHRRHDVLRHKLPVPVWADILKDTVRVHDFVELGKTAIGYAICVDEGGHLSRRDLTVYVDQQAWDGRPRHDHPVTALIHRYPPVSQT